MDERPNREPSKIRALNVIFPVVGLVYPDMFLTIVAIQQVLTTGKPPDFLIFFIPVMIAFLLLAIGIWFRKRISYIATAIFLGIFIIFGYGLNWEHGIGVFANPAGTVEFVFVVTSLPALVGAFYYSILGWRETRTGKATGIPPERSMPRSSVVALIALGFAMGGLAVGLLAGPTQARLLAAVGQHSDISLAVGSGSPTNGQFYVPQSFTVKVGGTVVWANQDSTAHTVTGDGGAFDSGNMASGDTFKFAFTQTGTYTYHCTYHTWMKGTIVVVSGQ